MMELKLARGPCCWSFHENSFTFSITLRRELENINIDSCRIFIGCIMFGQVQFKDISMRLAALHHEQLAKSQPACNLILNERKCIFCVQIMVCLPSLVFKIPAHDFKNYQVFLFITRSL